VRKRTKEELLGRYSRRDPRPFVQFDAFDDVQGDTEMPTDENGYSLSAIETFELMRGSTVRVLIKPGTTPETALALLDKIKEWIETNPSTLVDLSLRVLGYEIDDEEVPF
jgi:hypothetical protein